MGQAIFIFDQKLFVYSTTMALSRIIVREGDGKKYKKLQQNVFICIYKLFTSRAKITGVREGVQTG